MTPTELVERVREECADAVHDITQAYGDGWRDSGPKEAATAAYTAGFLSCKAIRARDLSALTQSPESLPPNCTMDETRGIRTVGPDGGVLRQMPNPTDTDLKDPLFGAVWEATKTWDVNAPEFYRGYCGMNGSHVMLILAAIRSQSPESAGEMPSEPKLSVEMVEYSSLSDAEKLGASNNGSGKEWANYLRIISHNGETLFLESDAMEPEDCRFSRDLSWIQPALKKCYELGMKDAALAAQARLREVERGELHIVFDGPPDHHAPRFVECEDAAGKSVNAGEWRKRTDDLWEIVVRTLP